jgi:hypothetical protein
MRCSGKAGRHSCRCGSQYMAHRPQLGIVHSSAEGHGEAPPRGRPAGAAALSLVAMPPCLVERCSLTAVARCSETEGPNYRQLLPQQQRVTRAYTRRVRVSQRARVAIRARVFDRQRPLQHGLYTSWSVTLEVRQMGCARGARSFVVRELSSGPESRCEAA